MPPPSKNDAGAKPAAKPEAVDASAASAAPARSRGVAGAWLPAILALLIAPAGTWATVEYVLLPRIQQKLTAGLSGEIDLNAAAPAKPGKGENGKDVAATYEFQNQVVNLAGTMGTRYLKTSFLVTGADPNIKAIFEESKAKLTDVTLNVLSSLTLADLEEPGAKNVIREKLVLAYNQALGRKVAEQVYFSDFVIQ